MMVICDHYSSTDWGKPPSNEKGFTPGNPQLLISPSPGGFPHLRKVATGGGALGIARLINVDPTKFLGLSSI